MTEVIETWHDQYVMLGGSAAGLIGLLFVAVSIHAAYFADPRFAHVRATAEHALFCYIRVLALSIVMLTPGQGDLWVGAELVLLGFTGLVGLGRFIRRVGRVKRGDPNRGPTDRELALMFTVVAVCAVAFFVTGASVITGWATWPLFLLPVAAFLLLTSGIWTSWQLVLRVTDERTP